MDTRQEGNILVAVPHLPNNIPADDIRAVHRRLISDLLAENHVQQYVLWYYTPMALDISRHLEPDLVVYDCMDDLSSFRGADKALREREMELYRRADVVFTGGQSLYEAKAGMHENIHPFPSSIDVGHFNQARVGRQDPIDQAHIPSPRLGYFGVIDERIDLELISGIADARPHWQIVMVGPFAKLDIEDIPQRHNIHYLGMKAYQELPLYLSGWDAAIMPFALNEATRFISPTKTPEYLAGGKPVVSTPILDVIRPYGEQEMVWIASGVEQFVASIEQALGMDGRRGAWLEKVDRYLGHYSWDRTWREMRALIEAACQARGRENSLPMEKGQEIPAS